MEGARRALLHTAVDGRGLCGRSVHARVDGVELLRRPARSGRRRIPTMRLKDKVAIVTGAGQTPGDTVGNGRATAILFAREGARVMLADRRLASAQETESMIRGEGGTAVAVEADVTREEDCRSIAARCIAEFGR